MADMKGITCCGDCIYYDWNKKRCKRCASQDTDPKAPFFADCPLPSVEPERPKGRWIPVTERLPENGQEVFVAYVFPLQHRLTSRYFYSASMYHVDDGNGLVNGPHFENEGFRGMRVTHWMPLPEPPKETEK